MSFQEAKNRMVEQFERTCIQELLATCNGNVTKASQAAEMNCRAFLGS